MIKEWSKKIAEVKSSEELADVISSQLKAEWKSEAQYDIKKAYESKMVRNNLETKINEVVHTANTWFGSELVPGAVQVTDFLDIVPKYSTFINGLRWYHGRNMDKTMEVPVIGRLPFHQLAGEWTTWLAASQIAQGKGRLPTSKVTISQNKYLFSVDISDEEVRYVNVLDIMQKMNEKLASSAARTQTSSLLNGDISTILNTNINLIDWTPAGTEHYLWGDGLRKSALNGTLTSLNAWVISSATFTAMRNLVGNRASTPEDLMWVVDNGFYNKMLLLPELSNWYINGQKSTILDGAVTNILWSDVITATDLALTNATGKISWTPANNTKGQVLYIHKDSVQYGYSWDYSIEVFRVPWYGWQVLGYYYMWFSIANQLAGETEPTVAIWFNATV